MQKTVLVIDDEENMRHSLSLILKRERYRVVLSSDGLDAIEKLKKNDVSFILCDIKMPVMNGLDFLKQVKINNITSAVIIMMSAYGTCDTAIEALRMGAYDYISKPFKVDEIILTLKKAQERELLKKENRLLKEELKKKYDFGNIISESSVMKGIFETIKKVAGFNSTVLISGESGTGKELVARAIHNNSNRSDKPFIAINCAAIPEHLMESEFFGHVKGSFTDAVENKNGLFEEADGGTLFLDEIGELQGNLQGKLLRVIQEREMMKLGSPTSVKVDVRILAATAKDLGEEVKNGVFREDLYYRLNVIAILIPPLRERIEDLPLLVNHFIQKYGKNLNRPVKKIHPHALTRLKNYNWKGNVRELENVIERAVILTLNEEIKDVDLPDYLVETKEYTDEAVKTDRFFIKSVVKEVEKDLICAVLHKTGHNKVKAARLLDISYRALMYKVKEYKL